MKPSIFICAFCCLLSAFAQDEFERLATVRQVGAVAPSGPPTPDIWLKPESLSGTDGDLVTSWTDSSGNSYNATTNGTANAEPVLTNNVIGTYEGVLFDGSNDFLCWLQAGAKALTAGKSGWTVVVVCANVTSSSGKGLFRVEITAGSREYLTVGDSWDKISVQGRNGDSSSLAISDAGAFLNIGFTTAVVNLTNQTATIYNNGTAAVTDTSFGDGNAHGSNNSTGMYLGSYDGTSGFITGPLVEFMFYARPLTASELDAVHSYLDARY